MNPPVQPRNPANHPRPSLLNRACAKLYPKLRNSTARLLRTIRRNPLSRKDFTPAPPIGTTSASRRSAGLTSRLPATPRTQTARHATMQNPADPLALLAAQVLALSHAVARLQAGMDQLLSLLLDAPGMIAVAHHRNAATVTAGFACNDQVRLVKQVLSVNSRSIHLRLREAILVAVLLRHALAGDSSFLPTDQLRAEISADFGHLWSMPSPHDVHDVVNKLRAKLGPQSDLLETAKSKGAGYRISTSPDNIVPLGPPWSASPPPR